MKVFVHFFLPVIKHDHSENTLFNFLLHGGVSYGCTTNIFFLFSFHFFFHTFSWFQVSDKDFKTMHGLNDGKFGDQLNKAGYTATPVACGWAGAIFEVTGAYGQER